MGVDSMQNNIYVQEGNSYYRVKGGKKEAISKQEYDKGVFAVKANTQAQGPSATPQTQGLSPKEFANSNIMGLEQQHANPDAGAGSGATVTSSQSTVITLSGLEPAVIAQLQQQGLIGNGTPGGQYEVKPEMLNKLLERLDVIMNAPDNMSEIEITGDAKPQIEAKLKEEGIIDDQGNIINKGKFAEIVEKGIDIGGQLVKLKQEVDEGTTQIPVTTTTEKTVASKFKEFDPAVLKRMQRQGDWQAKMKDLQKKGQVVIIDGRYYTSNPDLQRKDAAAPTATASEIYTTTLVGQTKEAKEARDAREKTLQEQFLTAYDTNPDNAQDTLMHTKYNKQYQQLVAGLNELNGKDGFRTAKDFLKENWGENFSTAREGTLAKMYFAKSKDINGNEVFEYADENDLKALQARVDGNLQEIKSLSHSEQVSLYKNFFPKTNIVVDDKHKFTDEQLKELAQAMAYAQGLDGVQINKMAGIQFKNRFNTQMSAVYQEYQDKIAKAEAEGKSDKAKKLQKELDKKLKEISDKRIETENKDRADYAGLMARGQLNSEIGEGSYQKATKEISYKSIIAKSPKAKQFIEANKDLFYKDGKFDTAAWQSFWLRISSTTVDGDRDAQDKPIEDYYMSLREAEGANRNGIIDGNAYKGLAEVFPELLDKKGKVTSKGVDLAREMAETAGILTAKNNTAGLRAAYVLGEVGKGVAGAAAADLLANCILSKLRLGYAGKVAGTATGILKGNLPIYRSGTIQGLDKFVSESWSNGELVGQQITERVKEYNWETPAGDSEPYALPFSQDYEKEYSGKQKLGSFHLDPWAIGVGGAVALVKGLVSMKKIHDKDSGKTNAPKYSRRDYNERQISSTNNEVATREVPNKKYVADVSIETPAVKEEIKNTPKRFSIKRVGVADVPRDKRVGSYTAYNKAEDKKNLVAQKYGLSGEELDKVYAYLITEFNGLSASYLKPHMYPEKNTLNFPEKIPAGTIPGIDKDIATAEDFEANYKPEYVFIPQASGVSVPKPKKAGERNLSTETQGNNASGQMTARKRRVK